MKTPEQNSLVVLTLDDGAFLEDEIVYLAKSFERVFVCPSTISLSEATNINSRPSKLPDNVQVIPEVGEAREDFKLIKILKYFWAFLDAYLYSVLHSKNRMQYVRYFRSMTHHFFNDFSKAKSLKRVIHKYHLENAVFYDYWLLNSSLALIHLKKKRIISYAVSRSHAFDLYDNRHVENAVPYKEYKIRFLDKVATISKHGEEYLKRQVNPKFASKIVTYRLGVEKAKKIPSVTQENTIVSCSMLLDFKQVDKIARALMPISSSLRWVHFGDGPERKRVESIIQSFPANIKVELRGDTVNAEILEFYDTNFVTLFISLSKLEGLPVSMMEAQAHGIPIIAPPINAISEIVTSETGILLSKDYTIEEVTQSIIQMIDSNKRYRRETILNFFDSNFRADINFNSFIQDILVRSENVR